MNIWPVGHTGRILDEIDSTNSAAARRVARAPVDAPEWIAARVQTEARGRMGRRWSSPLGNLSATLLMPFDRPLAMAARYSFHTALAVFDLVEAYAPQHDIALKWPNDVLLNGSKVAGILLESLCHGSNHRALAIGVGVNLRHHPPQEATNWPATSLYAQCAMDVAFEEALSLLAHSLVRWIDLEHEKGFIPIRDAWIGRAAQIGEQIEVRQHETSVRGRFVGVDEDGALVLDTGNGPRWIAAGDVFFSR